MPVRELHEQKISRRCAMFTRICRLLLLGTVVFTIGACDQEGPAERAGESIDEAAEEVQEGVEEAGEEVQGAVESAREELEDEE
jgi:hypothetical protein